MPQEPSGTGVLVLAGSSGRVDTDRARVLAGMGATAESIQWFGGPGQHDGPWEIPLETFLDRVAALRRECDRVVVVGTSFGAEAALLTGAFSDEVAGVVAFAPTDVVWAGVTGRGRETSHWTHLGEPLPFVPYAPDWAPLEDPPSFRELYELSRDRFPDRAEAAAIPVERIDDLLLVAGGDDRVWSAVTATTAIRERRAAHGRATVVITDPDAGHRTILPGEHPVVGGQRMQRGGTPAADRRLGEAAWPHVAALLRP